ncbi:MAG: hypothetical protein KC445_09510 [Anaerolineales bacterium]|nr:hypothetical protein [Anaerolineales bacterium]
MNSSKQHKQMQTCGETAVSTTASCRQQPTNPAPTPVTPGSKQKSSVCCLFI